MSYENADPCLRRPPPSTDAGCALLHTVWQMLSGLKDAGPIFKYIESSMRRKEARRGLFIWLLGIVGLVICRWLAPRWVADGTAAYFVLVPLLSSKSNRSLGLSFHPVLLGGGALILALFAYGLFNSGGSGVQGGTPLRLFAQQLILVSLPEELFYRGYLYDELSPLGNKQRFWAINALFTLGHLIYPTWGRLLVFFPSLVFTLLRQRTGTIWASTLLHGLGNGCTQLIFQPRT